MRLTLGLVIIDKGNAAPPGLGQPLDGVVGAVFLIGKDTVGVGQRQNRVGKQNRNIGNIFGNVLAALWCHEYGTDEEYANDLLGVQRTQILAGAGGGAAQVAQDGAVPGGGHRALDLIGDGGVLYITDVHRHNGYAAALPGGQAFRYLAGLVIAAVQHGLHLDAGGFAHLAAVHHPGDRGNRDPGFPGYIINRQEIPPVGCNTL